MILRTLHLYSFRAHADTDISLAPKVNLLHGANGVGKTNVLEAIHYLCLTKSFIATNDRYAVRQEAPYFELEATFTGVRSSPTTVRLVYVPSEGKRIFVNGAPLERLTEIVGMLPVVVFSPEDYELTAGGPSERRRLLNNILSQAHPVYMDDLMKYRRARKQRNEVLRQYQKRSSPPPTHVLEPWTEELVTLGSRVIHRRYTFLQIFQSYLEDAYEKIRAVAERPTMEYDTIANLDDLSADDDAPPSQEAIADAFRDVLERKAQSERKRGTTLAGPQRDELVFRLDGMEVRRYGSQGQHRTYGMALKLAQYFYLQDRLERNPLLLLDDAFGKLDKERTAVFLELLDSDAVGQSFITATRRAHFAETIDFASDAHRSFTVHRTDARAHVRPDDASPDDEARDDEARDDEARPSSRQDVPSAEPAFSSHGDGAPNEDDSA